MYSAVVQLHNYIAHIHTHTFSTGEVASLHISRMPGVDAF